jgi:hypothetical protein
MHVEHQCTGGIPGIDQRGIFSQVIFVFQGLKGLKHEFSAVSGVHTVVALQWTCLGIAQRQQPQRSSCSQRINAELGRQYCHDQNGRRQQRRNTRGQSQRAGSRGAVLRRVIAHVCLL